MKKEENITKKEVIDILMQYGKENHDIIDLSDIDFGNMIVLTYNSKANWFNNAGQEAVIMINNSFQKAEVIDN